MAFTKCEEATTVMSLLSSAIHTSLSYLFDRNLSLNSIPGLICLISFLLFSCSWLFTNFYTRINMPPSYAFHLLHCRLEPVPPHIYQYIRVCWPS